MAKKANHAQNLGERLLRAGWITSFVDEPGSLVFEWTPLGDQRIRQLADAMREFGDDVIPPEELALLRAVVLIDTRDGGQVHE
jgi:hypothetical protein